MPRQGERFLYCDHVEADGEGLFRLACEHPRLLNAPHWCAAYHCKVADFEAWSFWRSREGANAAP